MKSILKYSLAIPVFAAVFLVAITAFPAQEQEADARARSSGPSHRSPSFPAAGAHEADRVLEWDDRRLREEDRGGRPPFRERHPASGHGPGDQPDSGDGGPG